MGLLHDKITDEIASFFIKNKKFGNRYRATTLPIFPKPDLILLGLSKIPMPQIAFEVKPPHAVKREYLTGLGQSVSYLLKFPLVYIILPDEVIDGLNIPDFIKNIVEKSDLKIGVISYNISNYSPKIVKKAILQKEIDIKSLEKEITSLRPRSWLFWMDTSLNEAAEMLKKIAEVENRNINGNIKDIVLNEIWDELLRIRYPNTTRPASFKLNYKLFLDTLNLWTGDGKLTVLGNRLYEICKKYGNRSNEFKDAIDYVILTEGGYLKMLVLIEKIQSSNEFIRKGSTAKLNKLIRDIRTELNIDKANFELEKEKVLPIYKKRAKNCWKTILGSNFIEMGLGKSLTQINEELERRFGHYFQKQLETNFYLSKFKKSKGYVINWERVIDLIEKGQQNLDIF